MCLHLCTNVHVWTLHMHIHDTPNREKCVYAHVSRYVYEHCIFIHVIRPTGKSVFTLMYQRVCINTTHAYTLHMHTHDTPKREKCFQTYLISMWVSMYLCMYLCIPVMQFCSGCERVSVCLRHPERVSVYLRLCMSVRMYVCVCRFVSMHICQLWISAQDVSV